MGVSRKEQAAAAAALIGGLPADAPIGFSVHDEHLRFELLSPSMAAINGRPAEAHLGRRVTEILPAGLAERVEALLAEVRDTGVPCSGVELHGSTAASPDATRSWIAQYRPIELDGRRHVGVVVVDVTERRAAEHALRESERLLSGAQRMAGLGWWTWTATPDTFVYAPELLTLLGHDPSLGATPGRRDLLEFADAGERRRVVEEGRAAVREERPFARRVRVRSADGELRILDARAELLRDEAGRPVGLEGFVQDITVLHQTVERQRIVVELGQAALAGADLDDLFRQAVEATTAGLTVEGAAVLELLPAGDALIVRHGLPAVPPDVTTVPVTPGSTVAQALAGGQPVVVDDWESEDRFGATDAGRSTGMRSTASVVIGGRARAFGLLGAMSTRPARFGTEEVAFLQSLANIVGDAVERRLAESEIAELSAARGRLVAQALESEERARRRIAETLHDDPLQELLAAGHELYALSGHGGDDEALAAVGSDLGAIVGRLREVMTSLHPTVLQHGGLEAALHAVADEQGRAGGFEPELRVEVAETDHDGLLLSVARELLTNAARHAAASRVSLELRDQDDGLVLEVADDGVGIAPGRAAEALAEGRIGLASCRERMEAIGGSLTLSGGAAGGTGTRVVARAPGDGGRWPDRTARMPGLAGRHDRE